MDKHNGLQRQWRTAIQRSTAIKCSWNVRGDSLRGVVSPGLNLYVSRSIGNAGATTSTGDFSMAVVNPDAWTWYESPRFTLRTAIQSDGTIDILYYGYAAIAPKIPFGACMEPGLIRITINHR
jgi:hypothetical protein